MGKDAEKKIVGIHHVTAIAGDPQRNIDFYTGVLGLRLVKITVNFDDPHTFHLYYGDKEGHPGTILTFFLWPGAPKGQRGTGQATVTSFLIPENSIAYWKERFKQNGVKFEEPSRRFRNEEESIIFFDHDDLKLELVSSSEASKSKYVPREKTPVPEKSAIRGFHGITLSEESCEKTASLLKDTMNFRLVREEDERIRYEALGGGGLGAYVDLLCKPALPRGEVLVGTVHHVAWRTPSDDQQKDWRQEIAKVGLRVTPIIDRVYFHSIYFREPGGILFEIATDSPGFAIDEPEEKLGTTLKLPPWLEGSRKQIEGVLPKLQLRESQ